MSSISRLSSNGVLPSGGSSRGSFGKRSLQQHKADSFYVCACGERTQLVDRFSHHCSLTLDVNAETAADAEAEEANNENSMDVSANGDTLVEEDIIFPEESIHGNIMDCLANVNTLHAEDIYPTAKCLTGGHPTIRRSGPSTPQRIGMLFFCLSISFRKATISWNR
jgi:hypothetical protein